MSQYHKHGAYDPNGPTTKRVVAYFSSGAKRTQRLQRMSARLFEMGLRSPKGGPPNALAYAIGSGNRSVRLQMIEHAKTHDPM
ncbi:hypothetical protein ACVIW2_004707 [Bradyrhizobium huanghuaihaiense]|uniref:Uncharacterized protein n=1 Tax=Bradyrhizobium huanghuaihaiense TaxID=990078 RepID=A0A562QWB8_9BRAD|nr:hypothetical protein IQ16_07275 [Bradyrhizobium huanghuaihaiense]